MPDDEFQNGIKALVQDDLKTILPVISTRHKLNAFLSQINISQEKDLISQMNLFQFNLSLELLPFNKISLFFEAILQEFKDEEEMNQLDLSDLESYVQSPLRMAIAMNDDDLRSSLISSVRKFSSSLIRIACAFIPLDELDTFLEEAFPWQLSDVVPHLPPKNLRKITPILSEGNLMSVLSKLTNFQLEAMISSISVVVLQDILSFFTSEQLKLVNYKLSNRNKNKITAGLDVLRHHEVFNREDIQEVEPHVIAIAFSVDDLKDKLIAHVDRLHLSQLQISVPTFCVDQILSACISGNEKTRQFVIMNLTETQKQEVVDHMFQFETEHAEAYPNFEADTCAIKKALESYLKTIKDLNKNDPVEKYDLVSKQLLDSKKEVFRLFQKSKNFLTNAQFYRDFLSVTNYAERQELNDLMALYQSSHDKLHQMIIEINSENNGWQMRLERKKRRISTIMEFENIVPIFPNRKSAESTYSTLRESLKKIKIVPKDLDTHGLSWEEIIDCGLISEADLAQKKIVDLTTLIAYLQK